ncbi:hypothetical protein K438DRAFT_2012090 [Mycena galopus ATCC 62051]|nr:hypothetical protein K438DRAFT_2012090 [Mycena galopus ATCC 62051]
MLMVDSLLVTPSGPTVLDGVTSLPVDALDVFNYGASNAYVVPELIDIPRFAAALAKALVLFPLYGARVKCADGGGMPWVITLPPLGLPFTFASNLTTDPLVMASPAVVQHPLPFTPPLTPARQIPLNSDTPLAAVLVTHFPNLSASCIAVRRWHPIGSDFVASRFIRAVSKFYLSPSLSVEDLDEPRPVYECVRKYLPPNADRALLQGIDTSALETYYNPTPAPYPPLPISTLVSTSPNVRLDFCLSGTQISTLRAAILSLGGPNASFVSAQDCLVALVAVAINAADSTAPKIHTVDTILDVRGQAGVPAELGWNGWTFAPTDRIETANLAHTGTADEADLYTYASAVRRSLARARDPAFLAALVDLQATRAAEAIALGAQLAAVSKAAASGAEAAKRGAGAREKWQGSDVLDLRSKPRHMCVNSTLRLDTVMRPHTHFGHPGQVKSYVGTVPFVKHLKLARPNEPLPSSDRNPFRAAADADEDERMSAVEGTLFFPSSAAGHWLGGVGPRERFVREMEGMMGRLGAGAVRWV